MLARADGARSRCTCEGGGDAYLRAIRDTLLPELGRRFRARSIGFRPGVDFLSIVEEGGTHQSGSWQHRVPGMLRFLYPPPRD